MGSRSRMLCVACVAVAASVPAPATNSAVLTLSGHVIAAGARESLRSPCAHLVATIGEANVGHAWSAHYALSSGYPTSAAAPLGDDVFFSSFEECTP